MSEEFVRSIRLALNEAEARKAHHVVQSGHPPSHVVGRNMALCVTHLEDALLRAQVAVGEIDVG